MLCANLESKLDSMPLTLYRYHSGQCKKKLLEAGLPSKAHSSYKECNCVIWIKGRTDTGFTPRRSTGYREWKMAEAYMLSLDAESKDTAVHGPTLANCIERYLDSRKAEMGRKSHNQYRLVLDWLKNFAHQRGCLHIEQLTIDLCEDFRVYGFPKKMARTSMATYDAKFLRFLKDAERRDWVKESLATKLKPIVAHYEEKQPFTDKEVNLIFEEAAKLGGGTTGYATNATTFSLLLKYMLETGLRVSDAVRYDPRRTQKGKKMWIYSFTPRKTRHNQKPKSAVAYLTEDLKTSIDNAKWFSTKLPFAYRAPAKEDETDALGQAVYERMQEIGKRAGVDDCRPHRFRDTFAVRCLLKGMRIEDVSKLLCHSSISVTERFYAPWVQSRKEQLESTFSDAMVG